MFERLQKKWKVSGLQVALILCTFAIGGSLTGYTGRKIMGLFAIDQNWLWVIIYIILVTLLWPLAVLLVSIPFGQFPFFIKYLKKMGARMGVVRREKSEAGSRKSEAVGSWQLADDGTQGPKLKAQGSQLLTHIAIFASGAGSNAQKIIDHFRNSSRVKVSLIVCNKPGAGVLNIAAEENIPSILIEKERFFRGDAYMPELKNNGIDFIVLAGFLWKIPLPLIKAFPGKIINIHPALLPKYGGKGMYGHKVHEAVIAAGEKESGITIHYVDEMYDHGEIILQAKCDVLPDDTPDLLAKKIHVLEHQHYPGIVEQLVLQPSAAR